MLKEIRFALLRAWWVVLGQKADPDSLALFTQFEKKYPNASRPRLLSSMFGLIEASWGHGVERVSIEFVDSEMMYVSLYPATQAGSLQRQRAFMYINLEELDKQVARLPELRAVLGASV